MKKKDILKAFADQSAPTYKIFCRICGDEEINDTPELLAKSAYVEGWELTKYNPKKHIKIDGALSGDLIITCRRHNEEAAFINSL